jgi:uncharacterized membrane protein
MILSIVHRGNVSLSLWTTARQFSSNVGRRNASRFRLTDVAQQFVGAIVVDSGFIIPPDVWLVSANMTPVRVILTVVLVFGIASLALYAADEEHAVSRERRFAGVPLRLLSLFAVSGITSMGIVVFFREPSFYGASLATTVKAICVTGLFTTISAAVADSVL